MNDMSAVDVVLRPGISLLLRANIASVVMGGVLVNHGPSHQHHYQCHQHVNGIEQNVNHISLTFYLFTLILRNDVHQADGTFLHLDGKAINT